MRMTVYKILTVMMFFASLAFAQPATESDPESKESPEKLLKDKNFERFDKYTRVTDQKIRGKGWCIGCPKYEVKGKLTGRLDVASDTFPEGTRKDQLGSLHDQSGKFVGVAGFGSPPTQKYQLVIESVSDVEVRKLPKPKIKIKINDGDGAKGYAGGHAQRVSL